MKSRIVIFFAIIEIVLFSYFAFPFDSSSSVENRTLKTNIVIEGDIMDAVLSGDFQNQLEELMSDQIIFRNNQVVYKGKLEKLLGFRKRFSGKYYKYNNQTVVNILDFVDEDLLRNNYNQNFFNRIQSYTNQLEEVGADFNIYYTFFENYYCQIAFKDCRQISAENVNSNFYFANDILNNNQYAFSAGDHHLSSESQYLMFIEMMTKINHLEDVKGFENYYDVDNETVSIGSRELSSNRSFDVYGSAYKPIYPQDAIITANGKSNLLTDVAEWSDTSTYSLNGTVSPGYCGPNQMNERIITNEGQFFVENSQAPIKENILLIGNSQICGISPFFYKTFEQTHTFDHRFQKIDVVKYVEENDIDHVIYYGNNPFMHLYIWFAE